MLIRAICRLVLISSLAVLYGCAGKSNLYYWGEYEPIIYDMYVNPGKADAHTQIAKLTTTIQRAQNSERQVPPGLYAHLGMIYAQIGDPGTAVEAFLAEKELYPESAFFIDGIMKRSKLEAVRDEK